MENKIIEFTKLKRQEIKAVVYEDREGVIVSELNRDRFDKLQKELECPIIIFNPDQEKMLKIKKLIGNSFLNNNKEIEIDGEDILLTVLPLITNIVLDLDRQKDKEQIQEILRDPSPILERSIIIVKEILKDITYNYLTSVKEMIQMPKEQRDKILKNNEPKLSEKEQKKLELKKQLAELEKEDEITNKE